LLRKALEQENKMKTCTKRRNFLAQTMMASCSIALKQSLAGAMPLRASAPIRTPGGLAMETLGKTLLGQMKWLNEPASAKQNGEQLTVMTKAKTDFWRKTFYGYVTDNGHFFSLPVTGDFTFESRVAGQYSSLYDQAGLMVRVDSSNWMKCGIELVDGIGHASVVMTREYSDWSTVRGVTSKEPIWWRVVRKSDSLETLYSLDGKNFTSARLGYLALPATANVGIMCAAPEGKGFEITFDAVKLVQ